MKAEDIRMGGDGTQSFRDQNIETGDLRNLMMDNLMSNVKTYTNEPDGTSKVAKNNLGIQQALAITKSTLVNKYERDNSQSTKRGEREKSEGNKNHHHCS